MERAIFAGGCFWCMVHPFEEMDGVASVLSGYTAGHVPNPTYEQVCSKTTGHTEAVEIIFDPEKISYQQLVEIYWAQTDPTDAFGQFEDRGDNYRPVIFYTTDAQRAIAEQSKADLQASGRFDRPIVTTIEPAQPFYPAEDYHQAFYRKSPQRYALSSQRRKAFLEENWT
ncbi:peptide-methionine (S)-S-oxide reductase MsrA [Streptococcus caprae]|uniref:Peptide methionine sulfoxide reductase MsrA n=1 Tax=Streptococcus caprae TaxID=1640501 RepID=A0ABV8CWC5_9STRE